MWWGTTGGSGAAGMAGFLLRAGSGAMSDEERMARTIRDIMRKNDIDLGKMIASRFKEELEAKQVFPSIVEDDGDATFTFAIYNYGLLWSSWGYSVPPYPLKPALNVQVYLKKGDGTLVWHDYAVTDDYTGGVDRYMFDEYVADPNLLRKGFEQAASKIVDQFFKNVECK
jgi:hypothetical protein